MPTYGYRCLDCGVEVDAVRSVEDRDSPPDCICGGGMVRTVAAVGFKFAGRVVKGGGPDRFTADVLGIPLKDLPEGLKTK